MGNLIPNTMIKPEEIILSAYRKTRTLIYHDRSNLETRRLFALLSETPQHFDDLKETVLEAITNKDPLTEDSKFGELLASIKLELRPKRFSENHGHKNPDSPDFISNVDLTDKFEVDKFNYFIICDPAIHLISTLWIMYAGSILSEKFSSDSFGSRLHKEILNLKSKKTFNYYPKDYAKWRDTAIDLTKRTINDDKQNATIVGLDIKEFYYHTVIDWQNICDTIRASNRKTEHQSLAIILTQRIREICESYRLKLVEISHTTHPEIGTEKTPLPIGLNFSPVLANWTLTNFDNLVRDHLNPTYYGRYIDDMLFVLSSRDLPKADTTKSIVDEFLDRYFFKRGLLEKSKDSETYTLRESPNLTIQSSKIKIQHFDKRGSLAALDKFQKSIREISSEFRFLPEPASKERIEELSHDLHYAGSPHSLRSIKGFSINRWHLSQILTSSAMARLFTGDTKKLQDESDGLLVLFQGREGLEMFDMWEKLFSTIALGRQYGLLKRVYWDLFFRIGRLNAKPEALNSSNSLSDQLILTNHLRAFLRNHLKLSIAMSASVVGLPALLKDKSWASNRDRDLLLEIGPIINILRRSNLIRHHYIGTPLINFISADKININEDWSLIKTYWEGDTPDPARIEDSPRHIHNEEDDYISLLQMALIQTQSTSTLQ